MDFMQAIFEATRDCWNTIHSGGWPELGWWSYLLLTILVATEGPVSTLIGAAAAAAGILDIRFVFVSAFAGNVLGDSLWYSVGYLSDLKRIHRFGRWFGLQNHHVDRLEQEMHRHATKLITLSKVAIGLIIPTLVAAGLARVPWRRWFPLVLVVETAWTFLIVNLGYHGTGLIAQMEKGIQTVGIVVLALIIGVALWYGRRFFAESETAMDLEDQHYLHLEINLSSPSSLPTSPTITVGTSLAEQRHFTPWRNSSFQPLHRHFHRAVGHRRTAYKQLCWRFPVKQLPEKPLARRPIAARSMMTRAMAEGRSALQVLATASSPTYLQEVHFAGD